MLAIFYFYLFPSTSNFLHALLLPLLPLLLTPSPPSTVHNSYCFLWRDLFYPWAPAWDCFTIVNVWFRGAPPPVRHRWLFSFSLKGSPLLFSSKKSIFCMFPVLGGWFSPWLWSPKNEGLELFAVMWPIPIVNVISLMTRESLPNFPS